MPAEPAHAAGHSNTEPMSAGHAHAEPKSAGHAHVESAGHQHESPAESAWDWAGRADDLTAEAEIGLGWARPAMAWISTRLDRAAAVVLDVGSGPGVFTGALADQFPDADLVAVDGSAALLERAAARAATSGYAKRLRTIEGTLDADVAHRLPPADVIWASHVLHHVPDPAATLAMLGAALRPGGVLALVEGGLPTRFLPEECGVGAPGLFDRLDAAISSRIHHHLRAERAPGVDAAALNWPAQLSAAGLTPSGSRSFLLDVPAPVPAAVRRFVTARTADSRQWAAETLSSADTAALDRLLDTDDTLGLAQRSDLFLLSASTVHTARRP